MGVLFGRREGRADKKFAFLGWRVESRNDWPLDPQNRIDFENESKWQWLRLWRNLEWLPVLVVCVMGESMQLVGYGP